MDRDDAVRVRDLIAEQGPTAADTADDAPEEGEQESPGEPESRLLLENPPAAEPAVDRPHYMPLFVAPQPIDTRLDDDDAADDDADDDDSDFADTPGADDGDEQIDYRHEFVSLDDDPIEDMDRNGAAMGSDRGARVLGFSG
ncbi:hypothetical protein BV508_30895, partial [Mycobacterium intermedium]